VAGLVRLRAGDHAHAARMRLPPERGLAVPEVGAAPGGQVEVRRDGGLRAQESAVALEQRHVAVGRRHRGEPPPDLGGVEHLVRQPPLFGAAPASGHGDALRRPDHQAAGERDEIPATVVRQRVPQVVCVQQQGDVGRVLEVGLPRHARPTVAGSLVVRGPEPFQAEHALPARGEMVGGGAAHATESDHDDVVHAASHAGSSNR
jgi:hypothetical protein